MDFSECRGLDLWEFVEGRAAARRGEPLDPHQTPWWQYGFRDWSARNEHPGRHLQDPSSPGHR